MRMPKRMLNDGVVKAVQEREWEAIPAASGSLAERLGLPPKAETIKRAKAIATQSKSVSITIRVPETGLERARAIAEKKGLPYQSYLKMLIHEGLERDKKILIE
jgi:hypothetical protein